MTCDHPDEGMYFHKCKDGQELTGPGIHALVIGMSNYSRADEPDKSAGQPDKSDDRRGKRRASKVKPIFPDIPGAASGAVRFAQYLESGFGSPHSIPLHTVRLLLSPVDDESIWLPDRGRWELAEYWNVYDALEDWAAECDTNAGNLAILYIAGHGAVTGAGTQNIFLGEANRIQDRYLASINVETIQELMKFYRAISNLYIFDCCAKDDNPEIPDYTGSPGMTIPAHETMTADVTRKKSIEGKRAYWTRINAARVGTSTPALGAKDGTLLSWALLPLLMSAGEMVDSRFTVTTQKLNAELLPAMSRRRRITIPDEGGPKVTVGENDPLGITCPTPPPEFEISLINDLGADGGTVIFTITDPGTGEQVKRLEVTSSSPPFGLAAGSYKVKAEEFKGNSQRSHSFDVDVLRDLRISYDGAEAK